MSEPHIESFTSEEYSINPDLRQFYQRFRSSTPEDLVNFEDDFNNSENNLSSLNNIFIQNEKQISESSNSVISNEYDSDNLTKEINTKSTCYRNAIFDISKNGNKTHANNNIADDINIDNQLGKSTAKDTSEVSVIDDWFLIKNLLASWNMEELNEILKDNEINVQALLHMKSHHIDILLRDVSLGKRIIFENHLENWQKINSEEYVLECNHSLSEIEGNNRVQKSNIPITTNSSHSSSSVPIKDIEYTKQPNNNDVNSEVSLASILECTIEGLKLKGSTEKLNDVNERILCDKITDFFLQRNINMESSIFEHMANEIQLYFPAEVKETFYLPIRGKTSKGKLVDKFKNRKRILNSQNFINAKKPKVQVAKPMPENILISEPNGNMNQQQLLQYRHLTWEEVKDLWLSSVNFRRNQLKRDNSENAENILKDWPAYRHPSGHVLIDIDFNNIIKNDCNLFKGWTNFTTKIIPILKKRVRDSVNKVLLHDMQNTDITENGYILTILYLTHVILRPTSGINIKDDKTQHKFFKRYTIQDSQDKFLLVASSPEDAQHQIKRIKIMNKPIQPLLIVIGTLFKPSYIVVYFDGIFYKFYSALKAVKCCFQSFYVFKLDYPDEARIFWNFMQKYFFNVPDKANNSNKYPSIPTLINQLKN